MNKLNTNKISAKYSFGYIIIITIMLLTFILSLVESSLTKSNYSKLINSMSEINEVYKDVDDMNRYLIESFNYLSVISFQNYDIKSNEINKELDILMNNQNNSFREAVDFNNLVNTYVLQGDELIDNLQKNWQNNDTITTDLFEETQLTYQFISDSFKNLYTIELEEAQALDSRIEELRSVLIMIEIVIILIALLIFFIFYEAILMGITKSLKKLSEFAIKVSENPTEEIHIKLKTDDELELFADVFNEMVDTIQKQYVELEINSNLKEQLANSEIENIKMEADLQNSNLKLLQSRINPHFLYNTLNMITQSAYIEGAEDTAKLMEATTSFLRYNLETITKTVTIRDEIENIKDYLFIQKSRFGVRIDYDIYVDKKCNDIKIPCMIIQPIVENSIKHGISNLVDGGKITIKVSKQKNNCTLSISDNGIGMSAKQLYQLEKNINDMRTPTEHIGLRNSCYRMKYFNKDTKFYISSNKGTTIQIVIPDDIEEDT